jgi:hypothetical protein
MPDDRGAGESLPLPLCSNVFLRVGADEISGWTVASSYPIERLAGLNAVLMG